MEQISWAKIVAKEVRDDKHDVKEKSRQRRVKTWFSDRAGSLLFGQWQIRAARERERGGRRLPPGVGISRRNGSVRRMKKSVVEGVDANGA